MQNMPRIRRIDMSENEINLGLVYEGYTASAQYDCSGRLPPIIDGGQQPVPQQNPTDPPDCCDPPTIIDRNDR
jgi:hypothetical protein